MDYMPVFPTNCEPLVRGHTRFVFKGRGGRGVYYYVESHIPTCRKSNIVS